MGGAGGSNPTRSSTRPKILPYQEELLGKYYGKDIAPMSLGKDNALTRNMNQAATDQAKKATALGQQNLMEQAGQMRMSGPEVMSGMQQIQQTGVQAAIQGILEAKKAAAFKALQMMAGLKTESEVSQSSGGGSRRSIAGLIPIE